MINIKNNQMFLTDIGFIKPLPYHVRMGFRSSRALEEHVLKTKMEEMNMDRKFRDINERLVKFGNVGDTHEGEYIEKKPMGSYGNDGYVLKDKDGPFAIFGSAVLDRNMKNAKPGDYLKITRFEDIPNKKKGQNAIRNFKVEVEISD